MVVVWMVGYATPPSGGSGLSLPDDRGGAYAILT